MIRFLRKLWKDRRGNVLIIAAAALPFLVGAAGLATDTIQWTLFKRDLQRAADSGALAGVFGELGGQTVSTGTCSAANNAPVYYDVYNSSHGKTATRVGSTNCSVTTLGWGTATNQSVQVTLSTQQTLPFSSLFLKATPTITAVATAAVVQSGQYCVVSLDNNADTGIDFSGNATVNLGCGLKTNAKGTSAIDCGGSSTITATPVAAVGYIPQCSNFTGSTTYQSYAPPQADPFASINAPTVPNGCTNSPLKYNGNNTSITLSGGSTNSPATYCYSDFTVGSGKSFSTHDAIIIINDAKTNGNMGNLDLQGTVDCQRCVFILTSNNSSTPTPIGNVTINASAHLTMSPQTCSACTYKNILIYQDRRAAYCSNCNKINGDSTSSISGAIYMPTQEVQFNGSGGMSTDCVQMVGWQVQFSGNATISNTCPSGGPQAFSGQMVRLVA